jgi:hypothetical protein
LEVEVLFHPDGGEVIAKRFTQNGISQIVKMEPILVRMLRTIS